MQIRIIRDRETVLDCHAKRSPHLASLVRILLAIATCFSERCAVRLATEVHANHFSAELPATVDDATTDAAFVDEYTVRLLAFDDLADARCELHRVEAAILEAPWRARVFALAQIDHARVVAEARNIDAHDERIVQMRYRLTLARKLDVCRWNELHVTCRWEFAAHADLEEVAVFAVVVKPLLNVNLIDAFDRARVEVQSRPAMFEPSEALTEAASVLRRIAIDEPHDLSLLVGQCAFAHFPNLVMDRRRFVEEQHDAVALVVQTGEGFGVVLRPRNDVDAPSLLATFIGRIDRGGRDGEHEAVEREPVPLRDLRPRLCAKLCVSRRRDDAACVFARRHRPTDHPCDERRLAWSVAGRDSLLNNLIDRPAVAKLFAKLAKKLPLPFARTLEAVQHAFAPRVCPQHVPERIKLKTREIVEDRFFERALVVVDLWRAHRPAAARVAATLHILQTRMTASK